jgi:hypothetical protein
MIAHTFSKTMMRSRAQGQRKILTQPFDAV